MKPHLIDPYSSNRQTCITISSLQLTPKPDRLHLEIYQPPPLQPANSNNDKTVVTMSNKEIRIFSPPC
jgi:hypothetical protein